MPPYEYEPISRHAICGADRVNWHVFSRRPVIFFTWNLANTHVCYYSPEMYDFSRQYFNTMFMLPQF